VGSISGVAWLWLSAYCANRLVLNLFNFYFNSVLFLLVRLERMGRFARIEDWERLNADEEWKKYATYIG
jgi:hypothetical protein